MQIMGLSMRKIIFGAMLGLIATQAAAANWVTIGLSQDDIRYSYDVDSLKPQSESHISAWVRTEKKSPQGVYHADAEEMIYFDCKDNSQAVRSYIRLGVAGASWSIPEYRLRFDPVPPDTMMDKVQKRLCG